MWNDVAWKDFRDALRSRFVVGASVLLIALSLGTLGLELVRGTTPETPTRLLFLLGGAFSWAVPIIALVTSYGAILHERNSGSLRFLLGLPNSRRDIIVGKFLGRSGTVAVPIVGGVVVVLAGMVAAGIPVLLFVYLPFLALTVLLGVTFVGIGLAISTLSTSGTRTIAAAVGLYFVFRLVWRVLLTLAVYLSYGYQPLERELPAWYFIVGRANPITAYLGATNVLSQPTDVTNFFVQTPSPSVAASVPSPWLELASLCLWGGVALVAGYYRFSNMDLQ